MCGQVSVCPSAGSNALSMLIQNIISGRKWLIKAVHLTMSREERGRRERRGKKGKKEDE